MAGANAWAPLWAALAKYGVTVADAEKVPFENWIEPLADTDANAIVSAIASHVELNGLASMLNGDIRSALVGSEAQIDTMINANIAGGVDGLLDMLSKLAASPT